MGNKAHGKNQVPTTLLVCSVFRNLWKIKDKLLYIVPPITKKWFQCLLDLFRFLRKYHLIWHTTLTTLTDSLINLMWPERKTWRANPWTSLEIRHWRLVLALPTKTNVWRSSLTTYWGEKKMICYINSWYWVPEVPRDV